MRRPFSLRDRRSPGHFALAVFNVDGYGFRFASL